VLRGVTSGSVTAMGPEWIVVLVVVLLLFGSSQLPKLARSLGQAQKEFKQGMEEGSKADSATDASTETKS
jgi:sec-independent protein translocase protein TatA